MIDLFYAEPVVELLHARAIAATSEVAEMLGVRRATAFARLCRLHQRGIVVHVRRGTAAFWALPGTIPRAATTGLVHKQSIWMPRAMMAEMCAEARRLDRTVAWIVARAWKHARGTIRQIPPVGA